MNIVILGAGVVGLQIASQLVSEGHDVAVIEKDPDRAKHISGHMDCMVLNEEGNNRETLVRAGIEHADFFLSVVDSDEVNMIACGIVESEFKVPVKVARVRNLDYSKAKIFRKSFLGIDFVVNPEVETARLIANTVALGADSDVMMFENSDMQIRNYVVDSRSFFKDKQIKDIKSSVKIRDRFLIAGIVRDMEFIIPTGLTYIRKNDNIYLFATEHTLTKIFIETGEKREMIDRIIIAGGGRIGSLVARYLIRTGRRITVIDSNYEVCKAISEKFEDALVLHSDISDENIFEDESLHECDLIITTTDNEELNILSAAYAKSLGVKRAIAVVNRPNYMSISSRLGIDVTVSPRNSTVSAIMKYIKRGDIKNIHTLFNGKAEVIEFSITEKNALVGMALKDISIPQGSIILTVIRNDVREIPDGRFTINAGDTVITIAKLVSVSALEKVFRTE
jgi:trk system potassium uptake protein